MTDLSAFGLSSHHGDLNSHGLFYLLDGIADEMDRKSKHERKEILKSFLRANPHWHFHNGRLKPRAEQ